MSSNSQILYQDVFKHPIKESFDIILLLNVIHHLKEPVRALRVAPIICKEKLIIEFPTLSDNKFNPTLSTPVTFNPNLPLIGVSLQAGFDQTFLFSRSAMNEFF
ncbi:MAG: hypothetical protein JXR80_08480 [Deltaproteobacteria bacterium]|nr:hypothetical protein [Deltaproteobacteria bacterium]